MPRLHSFLAGGLSVVMLAALLGAQTARPGAGPDRIRYDRDVRPILSDRCFKCHGADANARESDLRLDQRESAVRDRGGYAAAFPGDLAKSALWRRINSEVAEERMPPPTSGKPPLQPAQREILRQWIEAGAEYEPHWSFVAPARPAPPTVRDERRVRNEVDRFVLARLDREGVEPGPPADRATLGRRVFLDLTGLPPTIEELDAFLADRRPDAYERLVDHLFDDEPYKTRYAERMTAPWLDAARFADTCGIHTDAGRTIWPWRDWVLDAFRSNKRYDVFLTEQLAGDLLPDATQAQKVASGFNRNHVTSDEGGAINEEYLVEYAVDRTATTGSVFLGLTLGCARCHDHKFDPVGQTDFYRMLAFFNSNDEPGIYSQEIDPKRAHEPFLEVPSVEQRRELDSLRQDLALAEADRDRPAADEALQRTAFFSDFAAHSGPRWAKSQLEAAASAGGAELKAQPDGSVLASGANPDRDDHTFTVRTDDFDLRLIALEALGDPSLPGSRTGRAENGNAVLTGIEAEAVSVADPARHEPVKFTWAWADYEQPDGDFSVLNTLDPGDDRGWAVGAHLREGSRLALFLAEKPFGFEGGTRLRIKLSYRSVYPRHTLGRVRLTLAGLPDGGIAALPTAATHWFVTGPFPAESGDAAYDHAFGPENAARLDRAANFGFGNQYWRYGGFPDGRLQPLPPGLGVSYVGRQIYAPSARKVHLSLGSDDGIRVFLDGSEILGRKIDRTTAPDQEKLTVELTPGAHTLVLKIVNTGGESSYYYAARGGDGEFSGDLAATLAPETARSAELTARVERAWRLKFSPAYRAATERISGLQMKLAQAQAAVPRTMVMRELPMSRPTFVLDRGQYDKPDPKQPVTRGVPAALGALPATAPANRLGLAQWMTAPDNPLVARVAVNRVWEMIFGTGLVRTAEDFGAQGEWPSHPELLDWLAVHFRESGWDLKALLKLLVTSETYRQSSRIRPELRERDADDRLLGWFPRRRLAAEMIRDQALYVSGLLIEKLGGPSVKPYQPAGLWEEVAMPASNTRIFVRGSGDELWRRSLYTYWKRASPPPALLTFDAPTRESCQVRRTTTNTPLQSLALWNDEQFVEAARAFAQRALQEAGDDAQRLTRMFRRATGRAPDDKELTALTRTLAAWQKRYAETPADAEKLLSVGMAPRPAALDVPTLAAWTMVANAVLNLDAVISRS